MKIQWRSQLDQVTEIFNFKEDLARGRTFYLLSLLLSSVYNIFISGLFYTGFLTMYDISITGTGIVNFIPYIATLFSIFSSRILSRFKRRKYILTLAKIYFYAMYIVATTLMPTFVSDPQARLIWFCVLTFLAYALYAPFAPGITLLYYRFFPEDTEKRSRFMTLHQGCTTVLSSIILIFGSLLTDAVSGSPFQKELILAFRYFSFLLVLVEAALMLRVKEYPYTDEPRFKFVKIFTEPFRYPKFRNCMLLMFFWNWYNCLNIGLWDYYLLTHMKFSYTLISSMTVVCTPLFFLFIKPWRKVLQRYSWIRTLGISLLLWVPTEAIFFLMNPSRGYLYVPLRVIQCILGVGSTLAYANVLYLNLPKENSTAHLAFNTIGVNFFAFAGLLFGTFLSSISGDQTMTFLGQEIYSVSLICLVRLVSILGTGLILLFKWRSFTPDSDIADLEDAARTRKQLRELGKNPNL